jgi:hypothetical protein
MTPDDSARHTSSTPSTIRWRAPSAGDITRVLPHVELPAVELEPGRILGSLEDWREAIAEADGNPRELTRLWFLLRGRGERVEDFLPELDHDQDDEDA